MIATQARADDAEKTVSEALMDRRSTQQFAERLIDASIRDSIPWAAIAPSQPETSGHADSSWYGAADTLIYRADRSGTGLYDSAEISAENLLTKDNLCAADRLASLKRGTR